MSTPVSISPGQAVYVLERLARERVVSSAEIARYVSEIPHEIAALEARLYKLRGAAGDGAGTRPPATSGAAQHRPRQLRGARRQSSGGLAAKRLGGRFAGLIRRLPTAERDQYHAIKARDGVEAAIRALQERRKP
jgi:hypothetical protein